MCRIFPFVVGITVLMAVAHRSGFAQEPGEECAGAKCRCTPTAPCTSGARDAAAGESIDRMLPCVDAGECSAPPFMPYADDFPDCDFERQGWQRMPNDYDTSEESEAVTPYNRSDCREDPAYHYQYPGCPYIGSIPRLTPRSYMAPYEPPPPQMYQPRSRPGVPVNPSPKKSPNDIECPAHPEVDTMEFRRSDAKEGEFDRSPFNRPY